MCLVLNQLIWNFISIPRFITNFPFGILNTLLMVQNTFYHIYLNFRLKYLKKNDDVNIRTRH